MKTFYKWSVLIALSLLLSFGIGTTFGASKFPEKPITLICHGGPGGGADIFARILAAANDKHKLLPQPIVVENKPGGSGAIGFAYVAGKKGDPYFLLTTVASFITTPLMGHSPINYTNFTPIANFCFDDNLLVVLKDSKYKSLKDIIADAKANPAKLTVGGSMAGGLETILTYKFEQQTGTKFNFIAFGGGGKQMAQFLGGHVDMTICNPSEVWAMQEAGKVRIMGVFAEKRLTFAPDIPTLKEQGVDVGGPPMNRGLCAPGNIPQDARTVLEKALFNYTKTDTWKKYVKDNMYTEAWMDGPTYGKWLEETNTTFAAIYKKMGVLK